MVKINKQQIQSMKAERASGANISDLMSKYGVSKRAVYYHLGNNTEATQPSHYAKP